MIIEITEDAKKVLDEYHIYIYILNLINDLLLEFEDKIKKIKLDEEYLDIDLKDKKTFTFLVLFKKNVKIKEFEKIKKLYNKIITFLIPYSIITFDFDD